MPTSPTSLLHFTYTHGSINMPCPREKTVIVKRLDLIVDTGVFLRRTVTNVMKRQSVRHLADTNCQQVSLLLPRVDFSPFILTKLGMEFQNETKKNGERRAKWKERSGWMHVYTKVLSTNESRILNYSFCTLPDVWSSNSLHVWYNAWPSKVKLC